MNKTPRYLNVSIFSRYIAVYLQHILTWVSGETQYVSHFNGNFTFSLIFAAEYRSKCMLKALIH